MASCLPFSLRTLLAAALAALLLAPASSRKAPIKEGSLARPVPGSKAPHLRQDAPFVEGVQGRGAGRPSISFSVEEAQADPSSADDSGLGSNGAEPRNCSGVTYLCQAWQGAAPCSGGCFLLCTGLGGGAAPGQPPVPVVSICHYPQTCSPSGACV